ncbi:hypothetical protein PGT21_016441, partial [Puccinia graminis f. sp. tritici]
RGRARDTRNADSEIRPSPCPSDGLGYHHDTTKNHLALQDDESGMDLFPSF